jgi:hypothetical protein
MTVWHPSGVAKIRGSAGQPEIVRWAVDLGTVGEQGEQMLGVALGPRPVHLAHSNATGEGLVSNGCWGPT